MTDDELYAKLYCASRGLSGVSVGLWHQYHELWRVVNVEAEAFDAIEHADAKQLADDLKALADRVSAFHRRIFSQLSETDRHC